MRDESKEIKTRYIIYADDDEDDRAIFQEIMEQTDDTVELVTVENGAQTLNFLDRLPVDAPLPCLILLDVNMPVLNGFETMKRMYADPRYQSIYVIFFSTASSATEKSRALSLGAKKFITKPFEVRLMKEICEEFIKTCHLQETVLK